jgi:hypothetical protein
MFDRRQQVRLWEAQTMYESIVTKCRSRYKSAPARPM